MLDPFRASKRETGQGERDANETPPMNNKNEDDLEE